MERWIDLKVEVGSDAANEVAIVRLFDHFVGGGEQLVRDGQAERLGGLQINDQLELGRQLDRQICWFSTLQDLIDIGGGAPKQIRAVGSISQEAPGIGELPEMKGRRQMILCRKVRDPL